MTAQEMEFDVNGEDGGTWGCHGMVEEGSDALGMGVLLLG